jgi:hypothetical protein
MREAPLRAMSRHLSLNDFYQARAEDFVSRLTASVLTAKIFAMAKGFR